MSAELLPALVAGAAAAAVAVATVTTVVEAAESPLSVELLEISCGCRRLDEADETDSSTPPPKDALTAEDEGEEDDALPEVIILGGRVGDRREAVLLPA